MTAVDIAELVGALFGAWLLGFGLGYVINIFRRFVNSV